VPFGDLLEVEYLPDANHIFTGLTHQQHLIDSAVRWFGDYSDVSLERTVTSLAG
jgi:hypothetical protein